MKRWSLPEYEEMLRLVKMGRSFSEIAEELNRSEMSVRGKYNKGFSQKWESYCIWTDERKAQASDMRDSGMSFKDIGAIFNSSPNAVELTIRRWKKKAPAE